MHYMRVRKHGAADVELKRGPKAAQTSRGAPSADAELAKRDAEIERLRSENAALRQRISELEKAAKAAAPASDAKPTTPPAEPKPDKPKQPKNDREEARERMRADFEAYDRERAQWGGRPKSLVIDDIKRLLLGHSLSDDVKVTITSVMLRHIDRDQADIDRGIPRRTYRKVLADLSPDRAPGNEAAFIAFKALDVKKKGTPNWSKTIVIADDKVTTMSDYWRKRQERSEKAKAARKAKVTATTVSTE
jgi:hypothetical protein